MGLDVWEQDLEGNILAHHRRRNLVVDTGRELAASLIGDAVNKIAVGTNGADADPEDEAPLAEQFDKALDEVTYPETRSVAFAFTIASDEFNDKTIREFGLIMGDGGQTLFSRRGGFSIDKTDLVQIVGTWTITF